MVDADAFVNEPTSINAKDFITVSLNTIETCVPMALGGTQ